MKNVRVTLFSNFDCINSHWAESPDGYDFEDCYFAHFMEATGINPQIALKELLEMGLKIDNKDEWPDLKDRNPWFDLEEEYSGRTALYHEIENRSSPACLFVILGKIDFEYDNTETIIIPKGNNCGFYSSDFGGGSMLELQLSRDIEITLGKGVIKNGHPEYDRFEIRDDDDGYEVMDVYGTTDEIYGNLIKLK